MDLEALPTGLMTGSRLVRVPPDRPLALPRGLRGAASIYSGEIDWAGGVGKLSVIVGEPANGARFVCADLNGDGRYDKGECGFCKPGNVDGTPERDSVQFSIPSKVGPLRRLPLVITVRQGVEGNSDPQHREIGYTGGAYVRGFAQVGGKRVLVTLGVSLSRGGLIDPRRTRIGIDANGNGRIDASVTEYGMSDDEDLVFMVGDRAVIVRAVDARTGDFALEERPREEYLTIDCSTSGGRGADPALPKSRT